MGQNFGTFDANAGVLYSLGNESRAQLANGADIDSASANLRDFGFAGSEGFLNPGSQCWFIGYSVSSFPTAVGAPTNELGLLLVLKVAYELQPGFILTTAQEIVLPQYDISQKPVYQGSFRVEAPIAQLVLENRTGVALTVSHQFWAKAF